MDTKAATAATINPTIVDAKGDLIAATAADAVSRLAVGANATVLTADSTTATGLKWAVPSSGGWTLDSTTTLSGASTSINLPSGYRQISIWVSNYQVTANAYPTCRLNADTSQIYRDAGIGVNGSTGFNFASTNDNQIYIGNGGTILSGNNSNNFYLTLQNIDSTTAFTPFVVTDASVDSSSNRRVASFGGLYGSTNAVTSFVLGAGASTWSGGTVLVYGVK
jgi:hypothetical protein